MRFIFLVLIFNLNSAIAAESPQVLDGLKLEKLSSWAGDKLNLAGISAMELGFGGSVLYVKNGELIVKAESGKESKPLPLPGKANRIYVSRNLIGAGFSLYAFDTQNTKGDKIYLYESNGKFTELVKLPQKVTAMAAYGDRIIFALESGLFGVRKGQKPQLLFTSPLLKGIQSIDLDSENDIIYMSTKEQVFSLRSGTADILIQGLGGHLNFSKKGLLIRESPASVPYILLGTNELLVRKN